MNVIEVTSPIPGWDCEEWENGIYTCSEQWISNVKTEVLVSDANSLFSIIPVLFLISLFATITCITLSKRATNTVWKKYLYIRIFLGMLTFVFGILSIWIRYREILAPWLY